MSHNTYFPFYAHPMDKKRSVQIIKEAKAEIRKMESHRPITPFNGRNMSNGFHIDHQQFSRPSSSASIRSLSYESDESHGACSNSHKSIPIRNHKHWRAHDDFTTHSSQKEKDLKQRSSILERDLKLQPIVSKPILRHRYVSNTTLKLPGEQHFTGFPPIQRDEKNLNDTNVNLDDCEKPENENAIANMELIALNEEHSSMCEVFDSSTKITDEFQIRSDGNDNDGCSVQNKESNDSTSIHKDANELLEKDLFAFFPILERNIKLGKKRKLEELVIYIEKIQSLLKDRNALSTQHDGRIPLLKLLFKLLDTSLPTLSMTIVKLLLDMKVTGKNLVNILRIILKLIKDEDVDLSEYKVFDSFSETMVEISIQNNSEAVLCGLKIMKLLVLGEKLKEQQVDRCVEILFHSLKDLNSLLSTEVVLESNCNELIKMIISILRYLLEDECTWNTLIEFQKLNEVLTLMNSVVQNAEIIEILMRYFSKIVDRKIGCEALSQCPMELVLTFLTILEIHRYQIDVTLQITFVIGNLVSNDSKTALAFVTSPNLISTIVVLGEYINEHIQFKSSVSDCFKNNNLGSSGDRNWQLDIFEVMIKILCIWANICLHPKAGYYLATHHGILTHLLGIVDAYRDQNEHFDANAALHSFLVVINNISYYLESDTDIGLKTAESVIPLLDDNCSFEVRLEAVNIVRNLTRSTNVRLFIQEHSLLPAFIRLLTEENKELSIGVYGLIMNLLIDEMARKTFYLAEGVTRVLHKLHLCADRDWKTSALLCQILWNYCGGEKAESISFSKAEVQHLIRYLSYSINKNEESMLKTENSDYYNEWANDFCPVGKKLLELLKTKSIL